MEERPPLHLGEVAIERGAFGSPSTKVANFTYLLTFDVSKTDFIPKVRAVRTRRILIPAMQLHTISKEKLQRCYEQWKTRWSKYVEYQDKYFKEN